MKLSPSILSKLLARANGACRLLLSRGERQSSNPKMMAKLVFPWARCGLLLRTEAGNASNLLFEVSSPFTFDVPWGRIESESGSFLSSRDIWMVKNGYHDLDISQLPQKIQVGVLESIIEAKQPSETVFTTTYVVDSFDVKKIEFIPAVASIEELQMHLDLEG